MQQDLEPFLNIQMLHFNLELELDRYQEIKGEIGIFKMVV